MKKCIFVLLLFSILLVSGASVAYADEWYGKDYGATTNCWVTFRCLVTPGELTSEYDFYIDLVNCDIIIDSVVAVKSTGVETKWYSSGNFVDGACLDNVVDNSVDIEYFKLYFYYNGDNYTTKYSVNCTLSYRVEPTVKPQPSADELGASFSGVYSVEYYEPGVSMMAPSGGYVYTFTTSGSVVSGNTINYDYSSCIKYFDGSGYDDLIQLKDNKIRESHSSGACTFENYYVSDVLLDGSVDDILQCDLIYAVDDYSNSYNTTVYYKLSGSLPEVSDPDPTPEITPDVTPEITPDPTPTNTPTPLPSPAPVLQLDAYVDGSTAVAEYYTGGCTPVKSMIEYFEVGTGELLTKLNSKTFLSGAGTMKNFMEPGKVYRYKLTYIYQRDGIQYEDFLWSDDLSVVDQELEDYRNSGKITNFRTLMLYTWDEIMDLDIPVEGFHIKARSLFIWIMIAGIGIYFWRKWNGG